MIYSIEYNSNLAGIYPQLELRSGVFDNGNRPDYENITVTDLIDCSLQLDDFELSQKANKTDILSSNLLSTKYGLIISNKAEGIFRDFANCYIGFKDFILSDMRYSFMHIINCNDIIDYSQSSFDDLLKPGVIIDDITSYNQYISIRKKREKFPKPRVLAIKGEYDIFRTPYDVKILISERLKNRLTDAGITGIEFKPYKNIKIQTVTDKI